MNVFVGDGQTDCILTLLSMGVAICIGRLAVWKANRLQVKSMYLIRIPVLIRTDSLYAEHLGGFHESSEW